MGYYTRFSLSVISGDDHETDYEKEIREISEYGRSVFDESVKWYGHEKDMREFSKKHPNVIFKLSGEGEETGDLWAEYYQNGKMQQCKAIISYPPFDESKLV